MLIASTVESLAVQMVSAAFPEASMLLLGPGFANHPDVPGTAEIARETFKTLIRADPNRAREYLPSGASEDEIPLPADDAVLLESFYRLVADMSPLERASLFGYYYSDRPAPPAYAIVAEQIRQRRYAAVVITYLDMFLSEMLDRAGLRKGVDYLIIDPMLDKKWTARKFPDEASQIIPITRLYGRLSGDILKQALDYLQKLFPEHRCVVVGYDLENEDVVNCLAERAGDLWWLGPLPEKSAALERIQSARTFYHVNRSESGAGFKGFDRLFETLDAAVNRQTPQDTNLIDWSRQSAAGLPPKSMVQASKSLPEASEVRPSAGLIAKPGAIGKGNVSGQREAENIISQPALEPFRQKVGPEVAAKKQAVGSGFTAKGMAPNIAKPLASATEAAVTESKAVALRNEESKAVLEEDQKITLLRRQLQSAKELLATMEQRQRLQEAGYAGLEADVVRQQWVVRECEQKLLAAASARIVSLLEAIAAEAAQLAGHAPAASFFKAQARAVKREQSRHFDADLVAAAVTGAVFLAQRMMKVDQEKVSELASYLPTTPAGRRR